jgi:uncharacterized iron-regulated membrane protein
LTVRGALVRLHRWAGLGMAGFLVLVGLTGSAIAWNDAGERLFAPSLFVLPRTAMGKPPLDPFALRDAAERAARGFAINGVDFTRRPDEPARFSVVARPNGPAPAKDDIALDPSTGRLIGARRDGDLREGAVNLMPFIYSLHDALALGDGGAVVLGIVALIWTVDCVVGLLLTFPARAHPRRTAKAWARRWGRAWRVRWKARPFKLTFDLHSAAGLWLWIMLGVLAWSAVAFNLPSVYRPVTRALFGLDEAATIRKPTAPLAAPPRLGWRAAHAVGVRAMAEEAHRYGFTVTSERLMFYDPGARTYAYRVKSTLDPGKLGNTQLTLDADTGRTLAFARPTGGRFGTSFTTWIEELHTAGVWGWPMQVFLTLMGLAVAMLSVTGVMIWLRKRSARHPASPRIAKAPASGYLRPPTS